MRNLAFLLPAAFFAPTAVFAASITYEASLISALTSNSGVASYTTTGADMTGMTVTASFAGGASETLTFAPTAANSGGASGSLFSISQTDTTYSNPFQISNLSGTRLETLSFDAGAGDALFDRTFGGNAGTAGSSLGYDVAETETGLSGSIVVSYSGIVSVGGDAAQGDLFAYLSIDLTGTSGGGLASAASWAFVQDTDTLAVSGDLTPPSAVPLPGAGGLFAAGLLAFGFLRRRA